jgi:hypothetical protein
MALTPTKVARGALFRFFRICERREGPRIGLGILQMSWVVSLLSVVRPVRETGRIARV